MAGLGFKASKDVNIDGNAQIITREPGIYVMQVESVTPGTKRKGSGDDAKDIPTININLVVRGVNAVHDKSLDAKTIVGKKHTHQVTLDVEDIKGFDKKVANIAHVLTKAGVDKAAILKVEANEWGQYQKDIAALFDAAKHNQTFNYKVIGNVYNGNPFTAAPGYLGFASALADEQKFSSAEIKGNNDYYAALSGQTPSADAAIGGVQSAGGVAGGAF